jgi:hypothetical protein
MTVGSITPPSRLSSLLTKSGRPTFVAEFVYNKNNIKGNNFKNVKKNTNVTT